MGVIGVPMAAMGTWSAMGQPSRCCESEGGLMGDTGVLVGPNGVLMGVIGVLIGVQGGLRGS